MTKDTSLFAQLFCVFVADHQGEFTDQLAHMSQSEAVFLLTTFANMATSREEREREFIEAVTLEVYEVLSKLNSTATNIFCLSSVYTFLLFFSVLFSLIHSITEFKSL